MKYIIPIFILIFTLILFKRNDELIDGNPIINCNRKDFFLEKVLNIKRDSGFL